jgi:hypothetical protein
MRDVDDDRIGDAQRPTAAPTASDPRSMEPAWCPPITSSLAGARQADPEVLVAARTPGSGSLAAR